jgi:hypothetical protein
MGVSVAVYCRLNTADMSTGAYVDPVLKANVYNSIFNSDPNQQWAIPQYVCGSGNCTFMPTATLAARAQCSNVTSTLRYDCVPLVENCSGSYCQENCTVSIGSELAVSYWAGGNSGTFYRLGTTANRSPSTMPTIHYITVNDISSILRLNYSPVKVLERPFLAAQCDVKIGVQAIQESIENSIYTMTPIGFWQYGESTFSETSNETLLAWWQDMTKEWSSLPQDTTSTSPGLVLPPGFQIDITALAALTDFVADLFDGHLQGSPNGATWWGGDGEQSYSYAASDAIQSLGYGNISGCATEDDRLTCGVSNMAKALTKSFRDSAYISGGSGTIGTAAGEAHVAISYVWIEWAWMSLPLCVWTLAAVLWVGTAMKTRRAGVPVWANDILPLLFIDRGYSSQEQDEGHGTSAAYYLVRAKQTKVQLHISEGKVALD